MIMKKLIVAVTIAVLAVPAFAAGRHRGVRSGTERPKIAGNALHVPVVVDITDVSTGDGAAVLAAYVVRVEFDANLVEFVRADGGEAAEFSGAPIFTNAIKANEDGVARLTAYQTSISGPAGRVSVANVVFREKAPNGAASIKVVVESAARGLTGGRETKALALPVAAEQ
jgi:hypothetical protein